MGLFKAALQTIHGPHLPKVPRSAFPVQRTAHRKSQLRSYPTSKATPQTNMLLPTSSGNVDELDNQLEWTPSCTNTGEHPQLKSAAPVT